MKLPGPAGGRCCAILLATLAGCVAGNPQRDGPDPTTVVQPATPVVRMLVDPASDPAFRTALERSLPSSDVRATFFIDGPLQQPPDYTIDIAFTVREVPLRDIEQIWGATTTLLLTLYPATCNRFRFTLNASVADSSGEQLKAYSSEELDTAWVWLLMGPDCAPSAGASSERVSEVAGRMLASLYERMQRDRILEPGSAVNRSPLVYATVNRAADLVEDGLDLGDSSLRFTFDPERGADSAYTLRMELAFSGSELNGWAMLGMLSMGLAGVCSPSTATLQGGLYDRGGQLLRHYRETEHWQSTMASNCALFDETEKPEVVRRLARKLQADLERDAPSLSVMSTRTAAGRPTVRITTNAARSAVEAVTSQMNPFPSAVLDDSSPAAADYLLNLDFKSGGGHSNIGPSDSMAKAAAVGFLFGLTLGGINMLCSPTTQALDAELVDRDGRRLGHYSATATSRSRGPACQDPIDARLEIAAELVQDVYRDLLRDPTLPAELRARATAH